MALEEEGVLHPGDFDGESAFLCLVQIVDKASHLRVDVIHAVEDEGFRSGWDLRGAEFQFPVVGKDHVDQIGELLLWGVELLSGIVDDHGTHGDMAEKVSGRGIAGGLVSGELLRLSDIVKERAGDEVVLLEERIVLRRLQAEIQDGKGMVKKASHVGVVDGDGGRVVDKTVMPFRKDGLGKKPEVLVLYALDCLFQTAF